MRKPNYFGLALSKLRMNGLLLASFVGGTAGVNATPAQNNPSRKKEQTLNGVAPTTKPVDAVDNCKPVQVNPPPIGPKSNNENS